MASSSNLRAGSFAFLEGWGRCGVDVFFVVSGFITVYIQDRRPRRPIEFLGHRLQL